MNRWHSTTLTAIGLVGGTTLGSAPALAEPAGLVSHWRADGDPSDAAGPNEGVHVGNVTYAPGAVGHLLTRGPYTIRGYYRAAEHNARAFTADGFYRTGDMVLRRPGGHLVVQGRAHDHINRAGEKISAEEKEKDKRDDKDRKERTRKSKRLWARKYRLRRKVEEAALVLSMLSQAV